MSFKGCHHSPESNEKNRKSHEGQIPWNKGLTKETDLRLKVASEKYKGRVAWNKGLTKEIDSRILSISNPGIHYHLTKETRKKQSIAKMGKSNPKVSKAMKRFWMNPVFIKKRVKAILEANHPKPNKLELKLDSILQKYFPNQFKYVGNGEVQIGRKCPDFININGKKQVIELFGRYWHKGLFSEAGKINHYKKYGFDCLVIWDNDFKNNRKVISKIRNFLE